jgi:hypothetical protein
VCFALRRSLGCAARIGNTLLLKDYYVISSKGSLLKALDFLFRDNRFLEGGEDLTDLLLKSSLVLYKFSVISVNNVLIYVLAEDRHNLFLCVSFYVGAS